MTTRSDSELLAQLGELLRAGEVVLTLDVAHLDKLDSPVAVQAESTRWLYGLAALSALAWYWQGPLGLGAAVAFGAVVWWTLVRRDVGRRIRARVETQALGDATMWRKLWRHGGVRLEPKVGGPCVAPRDNWMQFVRDRVPANES